MQLIFGIGALWGTRSDVTGVGPDQFAILQENSIDFSFELKELYGQLQFPVDIARGKGKITGKAKMARVFGALYADIFFGATATAGQTTVAQDEVDAIPATPYQVTVTNASGFVADLGVYYNTGTKAGNRLTYTSSTTPASTGQYFVNASTGVYTFNSADTAASVRISYAYTVAGGLSIALANNFMGYTPTFVGTFYQNRSTQGSSGQLTLRLNECVSNHLTFPSHIDDYAVPDFDFMALSNQANSIGTLSTTE